MSDAFSRRHIGPDAGAQDEMLRAIGVPSLDALIDQTIPSGIRFSKALNLPPAETEAAYLRRLGSVAAKNRVARSYIGMDGGRIGVSHLPDPVDRMLVATARQMGATFVTRDRPILDYAAATSAVRVHDARL